MEGTMKLVMQGWVLLALAGCAMPGVGSGMNASMADSQASMDRSHEDFMAAQSAAQAAAIKPGDEALSCDQLQAEMMAITTDPRMQAATASMGASAQAQMDKAKAAQAAAVTTGLAGAAVGIAGSFIPGAGFFQQGAMMAQQAAMSSQMNEATKDRTKMMSDMSSMMPFMMRGQRVMDLATAKKCAFLKGPAQ
jgi:TctA family transporter